MGSQVIARCQCGVHEVISIGGGMRNFDRVCYFPCLCQHCHRVVEANLLDQPPQCPHCKAPNPLAYDHPSLCGTRGDHTAVRWNMAERLGRDLHLTDGTYLCPACDAKTLRFWPGDLCWD